MSSCTKIVFLAMILMGFTSGAFGEGEALEKAIHPEAAKGIGAALCRPGALSAEALKSIDGISISGGVRLKQAFGASCEISFWRQPKTTATMKSQTFCYPSITASSEKTRPVTGQIHLIFGCGGNPKNYAGYSTSLSFLGIGMTERLGEGVFEDAVHFTGLAERAKGSDGKGFSEMLTEFRTAAKEIRSALADLKQSPAAAAALKGISGKMNDPHSGQRPVSDMIAELVERQQGFLEGIDHLIPRLETLRNQIRVTMEMPKGEERSLAERHLISEAHVVQSHLDSLRLGAAPKVLPFFTVEALEGSVLRSDVKQAIHSNHPRLTPEEAQVLGTRFGSLSPGPVRLPRQMSIYLDPKTQKQVGSLWRVPSAGAYPGSTEAWNPRLDRDLKVLPKNSPERDLVAVTMVDYQKATAAYFAVVQKSISAIESARGLSLLNQNAAADLKMGATPKLDARIGGTPESNYGNGCRSINIPLDGFTVRSPGSWLPLFSTLTSGGAGRPPVEFLLYQPGSHFSPTASASLSHHYPVGREQVVPSGPLQSILEALNACGGERAAGSPRPRGDFAHGAEPSHGRVVDEHVF